MIEFWPNNPWRTPCWRWLLARYRAVHGLGAPSWREGRWARLAFQMNQALLRDNSEDALCRLVAWNPGMVFAYELWSNTGSMAKDIVEAFILGGATSEQIAHRLCIQIEALDAYAALFYDVREKLKHRAYVAAELIGSEWSGPLSRVTFATVLKAFGYNMGPHVVDAMLGVYHRNVAPIQPGEIGAFLPVVTGLELTVKAAVAVKLIPVNDRTAPYLLRLNAWILERERNTPNSSDGDENVREGIDHVLRDFHQAHLACAREVPDWLRAFVSPST